MIAKIAVDAVREDDPYIRLRLRLECISYIRNITCLHCSIGF